MKTFQDWCVDTLTFILKNKNNYRGQLHDHGYYYVVDALVKHYASMFFCPTPGIAQRGKGHVNLWWSQMSKDRQEIMFRSVMMSKNARTIARSRALSVDKAKKELHWEHILPCAKVIRDLMELDVVTAENVLKCFKHSKLVLITKEESDYLDGTGSQFSDEDIEFVARHFPMEKESAVACRDDKPKSGGTAVLRLAKLYNNGVEFCTYDDDRALSPEEWIKYLDDATYQFD